jgi:hypothetical protein
MKITRLEIQKVPPSWVWLKVYTDDGRFGLGEPFLEGHPDSVIAEVRRLEPLLLGQDPRQLESLWQQLYEAGTGYKGGPVTMSAISGIDIALWDLAGKIAGLPIHQLLGGATRDRIRMYRATSANPPHTVAPGLPYRAGFPADRADAQPAETGFQPGRAEAQPTGFNAADPMLSPAGPVLNLRQLVLSPAGPVLNLVQLVLRPASPMPKRAGPEILLRRIRNRKPGPSRPAFWSGTGDSAV